MGTDENMQIAYSIQRIIKDKGISQAQLARMSDISQSAVNRYLNGENEIPASKAQKMADALAVSVDELLGVDLPKQGENELITIYRSLDADSRELLLNMARKLAR